MAASVSRACLNLGRKSAELGFLGIYRDLRILSPASVGNFDCIRRYSSAKNAEEELSEFDLRDEDEAAERDEEMERKRNKSGLRDQHFRAIHGMQPYEQPMSWFHHSIKYKKRMFGRYGIDGSDIPLGALWPTKEDLADKLAYEQCMRPLSLQQMMKINEEEKLQAAEDTRKRQADLAIKFDKIEQWKKDLENKIAKKKRDAEESKLKRDRMIEEVRRMVGYTMDPRDEKFKMLIEQKEKEQKKQEKEEKKALKAAKMMEAMMAKGKIAEAEKTETTPTPPKSS